MSVSIVEADLNLPAHSDGLLAVLDEYARLPHINGSSLPQEVRDSLIASLAEVPYRLILLAVNGDQVVGIAICFESFSTFTARRLINVHDLAVSSASRGQGVGTALLEAVADHARERGFSRVTLEVSSDNPDAKRVYERTGFKFQHEFGVMKLDG